MGQDRLPEEMGLHLKRHIFLRTRMGYKCSEDSGRGAFFSGMGIKIICWARDNQE